MTCFGDGAFLFYLAWRAAIHWSAVGAMVFPEEGGLWVDLLSDGP